LKTVEYANITKVLYVHISLLEMHINTRYYEIYISKQDFRL